MKLVSKSFILGVHEVLTRDRLTVPFGEICASLAGHPDWSTTKAVVMPTPPGHGSDKLLGSIWANKLTVPPGEICTMVKDRQRN